MDALLADLLRYGVPLVGLNVFLQQLGLPIPSVPTMMVAGAMAAQGRLSGLGVFTIAVAATVIADLAWYWAGRRFGYPVLRLLCRVSLSPDTCVRQTENIFERWGFYSLVVSKFIPGFSTVAPPVAGALRMPLGQFVLATLASATLWVGAALGVGLAFSDQIESILRLIATHGAMAALVLGTLLALWVGWKAFKRWRIARFAEGARIEVHELAQDLASPRPPLVVDVGTRLGHDSRGHIPGALLLDLDTIAGDYAFPRDRPIVFYCACPNEASAKRAVQLLAAKGFTNVRPLIGGIDGWVAAGHPTESRAPLSPSARATEPAA